MPYETKGGKERDAIAMGPPCRSKFCSNVLTGGCQTVTEEQRQWIFDKVWSMNTWEERRVYVTTLVTKVAIKQKKVAEGSKRNTSYNYKLKLVTICLIVRQVRMTFRKEQEPSIEGLEK